MTTCVALLRGINVGGKNKVQMGELRSLFEDLGYDNVRSYLQSGNVVFDSGSSSKRLSAEIEDAVSKIFGIKLSVLIRTQRELKDIVEGNPFSTKGDHPTSLHVMFLADRSSSQAVKGLDLDRSPPDEFKVRGREIYLWYPKGSGRSKLTIDYFERALGTRATARNWNTVVRLLKLMEEA